MPKSKRDRRVSLTKTQSRGRELKTSTAESIRDGLDNYESVYVLSFENMRTAKFKTVRQEWRDSRFILGKNTVMRVALGSSAEDEYKEGLHRVTKALRGDVALLLTNRPRDEVTEFFDNFTVTDYARSGFVATKTVKLDGGPLPQFQHTMIEQLRQLDLNVKLEKGTIVLQEDFTVCRKGQTITPEQARLLVHFDIPMAKFRIRLLCRWAEGEFERIGSL